MRLDNVAWDQALEMVLKPNGLTYQIEDEVLWVVPRSKLVDMEIAEKKRKGALMAAKRLQGVFEAKVIEFIVVRHRPVADIFKMLVGDTTTTPPTPGILDIEGAKSKEKEEGEEKEGKEIEIATMDLYLSYDAGTNMVIANGVRAKVDKVKELVRKLDVPEKQVLIEARIVEATTGFTRDLGIEWKSLDGTRPGVERKWFNSDGTTRFDGTFSTNFTGKLGRQYRPGIRLFNRRRIGVPCPGRIPGSGPGRSEDQHHLGAQGDDQKRRGGLYFTG